MRYVMAISFAVLTVAVASADAATTHPLIWVAVVVLASVATLLSFALVAWRQYER